jgi:hypothetical protein
MKKILAFCCLLFACGQTDAEITLEYKKQLNEPVKLIAIAPDGTHLWKVKDTTMGGTLYVYFASSGAQFTDDTTRNVPTVNKE